VDWGTNHLKRDCAAFREERRSNLILLKSASFVLARSPRRRDRGNLVFSCHSVIAMAPEGSPWQSH